MLSSVLSEVAQARGVRDFAIELGFLVVVALAAAMTIPVVGTLLVFTLMIGAPAAARSVTDTPGRGDDVVSGDRGRDGLGGDRAVV